METWLVSMKHMQINSLLAVKNYANPRHQSSEFQYFIFFDIRWLMVGLSVGMQRFPINFEIRMIYKSLQFTLIVYYQIIYVTVFLAAFLI